MDFMQHNLCVIKYYVAKNEMILVLCDASFWLDQIDSTLATVLVVEWLASETEICAGSYINCGTN